MRAKRGSPTGAYTAQPAQLWLGQRGIHRVGGGVLWGGAAAQKPLSPQKG